MGRVVRRLAASAAVVHPAVLAAPIGAGIAVFVVLGALQRSGHLDSNLTNLDSEASAATFLAAGLLWAAAVAWTLVVASIHPRSAGAWVWPALLAMLALDEGNALHEKLERWSGVDWQLLYLPIMAVAAVAWWQAVRRHRREPTARLLVGGAAAWATALILELVQNWGGEPVAAAIYDPAMVSEEALEMIGSLLILIAAVTALRSGRTADFS